MLTDLNQKFRRSTIQNWIENEIKLKFNFARELNFIFYMSVLYIFLFF